MIIYPKIEDYFNFIFDDIRALDYDDSTKPLYEQDTHGINQLTSLLERIQNNCYYSDYYKKAAYFFIALSTGHYFRNGNKRIALFSYLYFHSLNRFRFRKHYKNEYKVWLRQHFPSYKFNSVQFYRKIVQPFFCKFASKVS